MNKTDEELNQAEKMAKLHGVRMCDENGDTHGEELYCVGIDDIADIIREAMAEQEKQEQVAWVPLTDEDRKAAFESLPDALEGFLKKWGWLHFAKEIERRCKEKNK